MSSAANNTPQPDWLDASRYPFASRSFEVEGHRLHYVDEGEGPTLLFVHGTPSWSYEWRAMIAGLRATHRCIAVDHLGYGLSDKPAQAELRPEDHARRLAALMRHLDLKDVTLVVHDFGGPIGIGAGLEERDRVSALVVVNSWMWSLSDDPQVVRISKFVASTVGRFVYRWLNGSPRWLLPLSFADKKRLSKQDHRHYLMPFARRIDRQAPWVMGCEFIASSDFYDGLWQRRLELPQPTIVWGKKDPAFGDKELKRWRSVWPDAPVFELEDVGHFPQEEAPLELTRILGATRPALVAVRGEPELPAA